MDDRDEKNLGEGLDGEQDSTSERDENLPKWAEMVKKVMSISLGAAFMTEESVRSYLGEIKLPKEVMQSLVQGASRSKDELMDRIGNETIKIISKIDFVKEASRFVEEHKFKITAEIDVVKKEK